VLDRPLGHDFTKIVKLNGEANLPTWYSSIKLFMLAFLLLALARGFIRSGGHRAWIMLILALVFFGLSLDEVASFHERLGSALDVLLPGGQRVNTIFYKTGIWMFILAVPLLVGLLWMVLAMRGVWENGRATVIFIVGLVVFLGSAGGLEILDNFTSGVSATLQVMAEEVGEMLGVTIMLGAAYELLSRTTSPFSRIKEICGQPSHQLNGT
jgi:hypothetical protein